MFDNKEFILSSIREILENAVSVSQLNCKGIEFFPLQEYILQSAFLKMTGYSEQKLKCICWDLASVDYELRYKIYQHWSFGECSSIEDKNKVFNIMIKKIQEYEKDFSQNKIKLYLEENTSLEECYTFVEENLKMSNLKYYEERNFLSFSNDGQFLKKSKSICISDSKILNKDCTNENEISFIYEKLYRHRNRCAHNLLSYQQNLPKINALLKKSDRDNYFYYFTVLIILDEVFVALYKKLIELIVENNW